MSDSLPKPTSVEVGQWWRESDEPDEKPVRIIALEGASPYNKAGPWAIYTNGAVPQESLLCSGEYLGSGPNPEPSEWMIETCARHSFDVVNAYCRSSDHASCCDDPEEWGQTTEDKRRRTRDVARLILAGKDPRLPYEDRGMHEGSILSLYRILRSLGKW